VGSGGPSTGLFCLHPGVKASNRPSLRQLPVPEHQTTADSREGDPVSHSQPRAALGRLQQEELGDENRKRNRALLGGGLEKINGLTSLLSLFTHLR